VKRIRDLVSLRRMVLLSRSIVRTSIHVLPVLLTIASASAQAPVPAQPETAQSLSALSKQVYELRIEVATLRLAWQEQRMQELAKEIHAAERERRLAEYEDAAMRDEILAAETQLGGSELDDAGRTELTALKNAFLTEGQQRLKDRRTDLAERESALRSEWEREREKAEALRRALNSLQGDAAPFVPRSKPGP
jgi:hypothetical protein